MYILPSSFNFYDFYFCFHKNQNKELVLTAVKALLALRPLALGPARLLGNPATVLGVLQLPSRLLCLIST